MDNRNSKSESEEHWVSVAFRGPRRLQCSKGSPKYYAQTRQGCIAITEWNPDGRTNRETWIRPEDGIAGTRAYIDRLNLV